MMKVLPTRWKVILSSKKPRRIGWLLMGISISIQLNNPTKTLPKIGDDSINVDIIGMVKAHLQLNTNNVIVQREEGSLR